MDLAHEYAYLLVTGDFSEAEFEARTHLKTGWFYPAGTQEGHWFYPQNTMVIRGHTTHQYVAVKWTLRVHLTWRELSPLSR